MNRKISPLLIILISLLLAVAVFAASKEIRDAIVSIVTQQLGKPYISGQAGPDSFDCSGLVNYAYRKVDMEEFAYNELYAHGATAEQQYDRCRSEFISKENIKDLFPGDLIFLKDTYKKGISHVGVYVGGDTIIHASGGVNDDGSIKPVVNATLSGWITLNNFVGGCRVPKNYWPNNDNGYIAEERNEKSTTYKNPFQDFYDFYPEDGEFQKCMRSTLSDKFTLFYNGDSIPTEEDLDSVQHCFDHSDMKQYINSLPPSVLQCFKNALGSDFEKALADQSFKESPEAERQMEACPAFQEYTAKADALQKYILPRRYLTYKFSCDRNWGGSPIPAVSLEWIVIQQNKTIASQILYRNSDTLIELSASAGHSYFDGTVKVGETYTYVIHINYNDGSSDSAKAEVAIPTDICVSNQ